MESPGLDSWAEAFILSGIDAYMTICGFVAARAALLDYHLEEFERRLEKAMNGPRTFIGPSYQFRKMDSSN